MEMKVKKIDFSSFGREANRNLYTRIHVCGQDSIFEIDTAKSKHGEAAVIWSWKKAEMAGQVPENFWNNDSPVNDCKNVNGGKWLLVTDGFALFLLEKNTKKILFYGRTPNSHSSELLPGSRLAAVLSMAEGTPEAGHNAVQIYDISRPDEPLFRDSIYSGHGIVWNESRSRLYVLGYGELREYSLKNWETKAPELKKENVWTLPEDNGHELSLLNKDALVFSVRNGVYVFDLRSYSFAHFEPLKNVWDVKSVYYNEYTGQLIYTKAEESWWTPNVYMRNPDKVITLPGFHIYKARISI
jgi:hypothetical protein